jgi:hypothetical protein
MITTRLRVPSFIATLAMLSEARGAASLWSGGYAIPLAFGPGAGQAPPSFKALFGGEANLLGLQVPAPVFYFLGIGRAGKPGSAPNRVRAARLCGRRQRERGALFGRRHQPRSGVGVRPKRRPWPRSPPCSMPRS